MSEINVLDPNYPLMIILKEKAPGTYSHSKNIASILEVLGTELDLDVGSLKIAGYLHDIGKSINPRFFIENQADEENNSHDGLEPWMSHKIITSHIGDTAQILINDPNIPRKVIEICTQHHGTCVLKPFLKKRQQKGKVNPDNYRYKATKPQMIESAILMIVDRLEAASRSLDQANKLNDIDELVETSINELIDDEQLDDVEFTFGKFRKIKKILKNELASQFHKRVDYDEDDEDEEEKPKVKRKRPRKKKELKD